MHDAFRRISHQGNGLSVHEGHQVFVRQGKIVHVCINYANKLKVRTNDLELFAGEIGQLAGSRQRKDFWNSTNGYWCYSWTEIQVCPDMT